MKQIETSRLIIRNFIIEDVHDLHKILGDDETMKYCETAYSFEKTEAFLKSFCIDRQGALAAEDRQTRKVIGYILFNALEPDVYELGWFFNRSCWRQGYAYEACKAVIDFAFRKLHAHKIFAETIDTAKSIPLMKKLGMTQTGKGAAGLDTYTLLRKDWEKTLQRM